MIQSHWQSNYKRWDSGKRERQKRERNERRDGAARGVAAADACRNLHLVKMISRLRHGLVCPSLQDGPGRTVLSCLSS